MTSLEQTFNKQIYDEMAKENYQLASKNFLKGIYDQCIKTCYQKGARLTDK
jgi:hypothetical protein